MDKIVEKILEHPIATIFVTSAISGGIATIVRAIKGTPECTITYKQSIEE